METIKPRTASTAGTTDCARTSRRGFGLRRSGRTTGAVWCPEVSRVVRATRSRTGGLEWRLADKTLAVVRVTIWDYFPTKSSLKFTISTEIFVFGNFPKPLYRLGFCQYCWDKSRALKRFPVALPNPAESTYDSIPGLRYQIP